MKHKKTNFRYQVTAYDTKTIETVTMTREQVMEIDRQASDYLLSTDFGILAFRTSQGEWVEYSNGNCPGIGTICLRIIQATQLNPGEFLTPNNIFELTGYATLRSNNALSARLKAIREAHKESFGNSNFFLSRRAGGYAIAWDPTKSWMWIERIRHAVGVSE